MQKRDHYCIWATHGDANLQEMIRKLFPRQRLHLLINGSPTVWERMKDGKDGRPTLGIKIVGGKDSWESIPLGKKFKLLLPDAAEAKSISNSPLFYSYIFADYSGAADLGGQRRSIKLAYADGRDDVRLADGAFTRDSLVTTVLGYLREATAAGQRICFGFDHQFGVPFGLLEEIGISEMSWRGILDVLTIGFGVPKLQHPSDYARLFNEWCVDRGQPPYFYSGTMAALYGIPRSDPRRGAEDTVRRLTERCARQSGSGNPLPFNRVGDPGTVGGQTIMGLVKLRELLLKCQSEDISVKCWPFDGLDINSASYAGSHVLVEPYPTALRPPDVLQTDANDAIESAKFIQQSDQAGELLYLLNLSSLSSSHKNIVLKEGWIVGFSPAPFGK